MSKAAARRRGTIEQRGADKWLVRVTFGTDPTTGKQYRGSKLIAGRKKDAEKYLTNWLGRADTGEQPVVTALRKQTLGEWLDEYWKTWSGGLHARTRAKFEENLKLYVPLGLMTIRLVNLSPRHLQSMFNDLAAKGLSWGTLSYTYRVLRARLNDAVTHDRLHVNPMSKVSLPARPHSERRTLTPEQAALFLEKAEENRFGALWSLLLLTGLRPGEALALKWDDVDGNSLIVRRSLVRVRSDRNSGKRIAWDWELKDTKTGRSRVVSLGARAVRVLQELRRGQAEERLRAGSLYKESGLVFATHFGTPLNLNTEVPRHFKTLLAVVADALELEGDEHAAFLRLRVYDLRHSAATLLMGAGEHPKVVQERLGHASITLTLDTYSHVQPHMQRRAAERLDDLIDIAARAAQ
jgi:integrase